MVSIDWVDWSIMSVSLKSRWMALATSQSALWGSPISTRLCQLRVPAWHVCTTFFLKWQEIWLNKATIRQHSPCFRSIWKEIRYTVECVVNDVNSYRQGVRVRRGWTISVPGWRAAKAWGEDLARTAWLAGLASGPTERDGNKDVSAAPGATSVLWRGPQDLVKIFYCSHSDFLPPESLTWPYG